MASAVKVAKEGWLLKRSDGKGSGATLGNALSKWDRRFFVLDVTTTRLNYYKDSKSVDKGGAPAGFVEVAGAVVRTISAPEQAGELTLQKIATSGTDKSFQFAVITPSRVLTLAAENEPDMRSWLRHLEDVRNSSTSAQTAAKAVAAAAARPRGLSSTRDPIGAASAQQMAALQAAGDDRTPPQTPPSRSAAADAQQQQQQQRQLLTTPPSQLFVNVGRDADALHSVWIGPAGQQATSSGVSRRLQRAGSVLSPSSGGTRSRDYSVAASMMTTAAAASPLRLVPTGGSVADLLVSRPGASPQPGGLRQRALSQRFMPLLAGTRANASGGGAGGAGLSRALLFGDGGGRFTASELKAALLVQRMMRGKWARAFVVETLQYEYSKGSMDEAKRVAASQLIHLPDGKPIPLDAPVSAFAPFGAEVHSYMAFLKRWCLCFLLCCLLGVAQMLNYAEGGDMGHDLNVFNMISLGNVRRVRVENAVLEAAISGLLIFFLYDVRSSQLRESHEAERAEITPADFTVLLKGVPTETADAAQIASVLAQLGAHVHEIVAVTLSTDVRELILLQQERQEAKRTENRLLARCYLLRRELRAATYSGGGNVDVKGLHRELGEARRLWDVAAQKLYASNEERERLIARGNSCTGMAFVTFNTERAAEHCLETVNSSSFASSASSYASSYASAAPPLRAERPPEPEDLYWETLQYSDGELAKSQIAPSSIILCVALLGTATIMWSQYGLGPVLREAQSSVASVWARIGLQVGFTAGIIVGNIFIFILTPILAEKMERHHTFGSKQTSCFLKMYMFQVFNTVVASTVFYFWADSSSRHPWYAYGAAMIFNTLIGDLFFILLVIDGLQPGLLIGRYIKAPNAPCQREMNDSYAVKAEIYVAFRLQLVAKYCTITLIYSSALPLAYGLGALFLWLGQWIDRLNLLRRFQPPPRSPDALISLLLRTFLPLAVAVHLACAVMFYANEYWIALADPPCTPGAVVTLTASSAARCQTPATLQEARDSLYVVSVSGCVWGLALLRYLCRECCRRSERGMHVVEGMEGKDMVAAFLDMGYAEEHEGGSDLLQETKRGGRSYQSGAGHAGDRRQRLYLPPLPRSVLRALRSAGAAATRQHDIRHGHGGTNGNGSKVSPAEML